MADASERSEQKLKVFVSYSRDDLEFADQLVAALDAFDFDLLIDRQGISAGEDWQRRLGALIAEADTVVFLLSPSALQSKMCAWEIAETDRLSKRLLPVVIKPLGATPVPERFQELNYIFFYPGADIAGLRLRPRACRARPGAQHRPRVGARAHPPRLSAPPSGRRAGSLRTVCCPVATSPRPRHGWRGGHRRRPSRPSCTSTSSAPAKTPEPLGRAPSVGASNRRS